MSSAHEIVFKDVSVPAPNKSALKTKVSSSKKTEVSNEWTRFEKDHSAVG